ncbi:sodium:solute symporter family protein [bacterium]|nr:MAG: sodium:solute symporter family protein [bacterium]
MIMWVVFICYVSAMIYLGFRSRHTEKGDDYWTAARDLGGWSAGFSLSAGFMSISWSCVYAIQIFYWYGLSGFLLMTLPWMAALTGIYFLATRFRDLPAFSQTEMVRIRFGKRSAIMVSLTQVIVFLIWGGAEIYVAANLLESSLGIDKFWIMVLITLTIAIYSTWGGFSAVVKTDKLQFVFVASYLFAVAWMAMLQLPELDTGNLIPARAQDPFFDGALMPLIIITAFAYLPGWLSEADLWLRIQAARNVKEARKAALIGLFNSFLFVGVIPAVIAMAALTLFPVNDAASTGVIGNEGEKIISAIVLPFNNPWMEIFLGIGLLCASMSTIDTCTNIVSLNVGRDILQTKKLSMSKGVNVAVMGAAFLISINVNSLWDIFYLSSGLLSTVVALPVLATLNKRIPGEAVFYSSIVGFACTVFFYFNSSFGWIPLSMNVVLRDTGIEYVVYGIIGAGVGFAAGYFLRSER